jgi:hypothetical protein
MIVTMDSEEMDWILRNSKMTEKDTDEIGHKIKGEIFKRLMRSNKKKTA